MAYRINFYIYVFGESLQTVVLLYIWKAVFESSTSPVINGFTYNEMITYVFLSTITGILIVNDIHWSIGSEVRTGDIAMNLIKPVSYQMRQYAKGIGQTISNFMFVSFPIWTIYTLYDYFGNGNVIHLNRMMFYLLSCVLSILISYTINYCFGLAAFYVEYLFGFVMAKEAIMKFFSGEVIPLAFFPSKLLAIFNWLPFGALVYTPVMIYLGKYQGDEIYKALLIQLAWVVIMFALSHLLWKKAIKRLTILGG